MDDAQRTESIRDMIEGIDQGEVVLPEFQRDFVWEVEKTYDLFDSLARDVFIGSLIYGIPSFEITVREIDSRPRKQKGKRRASLTKYNYTLDEVNAKVKTGGFRLILDGQQRLTSMYRGLHGHDNVWLIVKSEEKLRDEGFDSDKASLEEILIQFTGQEDSNNLSINIASVWQIIQGKIKREPDKLAKLHETEFYRTQRENATDIELNKLDDYYLTVLEKFEDLLKSEKLISYYLLDTTQEKFALFFERSNSRGVQLNFVDILTAKLYGGFKLRDKTDEFESEYPGLKLNLQIIVRCIAYIVSDGRTVVRSYILKNLTAEHFNEHWDLMCSLYKKSYDWLRENYFIISQSWIPYENMLIPLIMFARELPSHDFSQMNEKQHEFIRYWYWASILSQGYSGSSNEVIIEDAKALQQVATESQIASRNYFSKFRSQVSSSDDIVSLVKKRSALYIGMLNLLNYEARGLQDWQNSTKLSFNSRLEDHHIFPVQYLRDKYGGQDTALEYIDCVANRTLIPKITNIKIGKKPPSRYLKELQTQNGNLVHSLENHLIPDAEDFVEGLYDENYMDFLQARADEMYRLVEQNVIDVEADIREAMLAIPKTDESTKQYDLRDGASPTGRVPVGFMVLGKRYDVSAWREMLLRVCEILHEEHGDEFIEKATQIQGRKRFYVSKDKERLHHPEKLYGSDLWVEQNLDAQRIISIIQEILDAHGYPENEFNAYWR